MGVGARGPPGCWTGRQGPAAPCAPRPVLAGPPRQRTERSSPGAAGPFCRADMVLFFPGPCSFFAEDCTALSAWHGWPTASLYTWPLEDEASATLAFFWGQESAPSLTWRTGPQTRVLTSPAPRTFFSQPVSAWCLMVHLMSYWLTVPAEGQGAVFFPTTLSLGTEPPSQYVTENPHLEHPVTRGTLTWKTLIWSTFSPGEPSPGAPCYLEHPVTRSTLIWSTPSPGAPLTWSTPHLESPSPAEPLPGAYFTGTTPCLDASALRSLPSRVGAPFLPPHQLPSSLMLLPQGPSQPAPALAVTAAILCPALWCPQRVVRHSVAQPPVRSRSPAGRGLPVPRTAGAQLMANAALVSSTGRNLCLGGERSGRRWEPCGSDQGLDRPHPSTPSGCSSKGPLGKTGTETKSQASGQAVRLAALPWAEGPCDMASVFGHGQADPQAGEMIVPDSALSRGGLTR
uniref:Uncharacterized protein gs52 n=1 Tax=Homo sapiens TaxID=9606 RepID=Q96S13_HUMAN|nr:unknown [Homo sapiens]